MSDQKQNGSVRERLTDFFFEHMSDPGVLTVMIHPKCAIMTAFTYNVNDRMTPSSNAVNMAIRRLEERPDFRELSYRNQFYNIQCHAAGIDDWNRKMSGGTVIQAVLSSAAGLKTIKYSDDTEVKKNPELAKKLYWCSQSDGAQGLTNTVFAAFGYAGGMDESVIQTLVFDPAYFVKHFLKELHAELPCLHLGQTLNKIVIYDFRTGDMETVTPTIYKTTHVLKLPELPFPC